MNLFRKKEYRPKRKTSLNFFWYFVNLYHERKSLEGYIWENRSCCDDLMKIPSKKILKRYSINPENITGFSWWLLEQYFEGNLVLKEKKDAE